MGKGRDETHKDIFPYRTRYLNNNNNNKNNKTYSVAHRIHCESKRVYVSRKAVALSAQNFRRHVDRSSHHHHRHRCVGVDHAGGAVVSDLCLVSTHRADEDVFGFDITMDNRNGVEVENSRRSLLW